MIFQELAGAGGSGGFRPMDGGKCLIFGVRSSAHLLQLGFAMSRRRIIIPGTVYALSRRTTRRHFLFHPDESGQMRAGYWYALAFAAHKHGVEVHAACLMSTHSHEVVTDTRGNLPLFLQTFHRLMAMFTKAMRGWPEEVYSKQQTSAHALLTAEAMLHAIAYTIANPVNAFAVRHARDWPGAITLPQQLGGHLLRAARPKHYYRSNEWPDTLLLSLTLPALLEGDLGRAQTRQLVAGKLRDFEQTARESARERRVSVVGLKRLFRLSHTGRANSFEAFGKLNPRFAARGCAKTARRAALAIRAFNQLYDEALAKWSQGRRLNAIFPYGTWWMLVHHRAECRPPP